MTAPYVSQVWDCWDALFDLMAAAPWTPHPLTGKLPRVSFGPAREEDQEQISLPGMIMPDGPTMAWKTISPVTLDEEFTFLMQIDSKVPGLRDKDAAAEGDPARAVRARARELSRIAETQLRNQTTGVPTGLSVAGLQWWKVTATVPAIGLLPDGGFGAQCSYRISFKCRI